MAQLHAVEARIKEQAATPPSISEILMHPSLYPDKSRKLTEDALTRRSMMAGFRAGLGHQLSMSDVGYNTQQQAIYEAAYVLGGKLKDTLGDKVPPMHLSGMKFGMRSRKPNPAFDRMAKQLFAQTFEGA